RRQTIIQQAILTRSWLIMTQRRCARAEVATSPRVSGARPALCLIGRRYPLLVEAALMHGVGLAHEDVGRDLVLGAAELSERREQNEIIEGLFRQGQAERPGFRAIFRSGHSKRLTGYNFIIMAF